MRGSIATAAAIGGAAVIATASDADPTQPSMIERAAANVDATDVVHAVVEGGPAVIETGADVVGAVAESGGEILEGAGVIIGGVFGALGALFD